MKSFAIVLVCYNRLNGLKRLLESIKNVNFDGRNDIHLIFSIDNSGNDTIERFAKEYKWMYGEKIVRTFPQRQGLKKHILQCGDYTEEYDIVVVLEDDLFVSDSMYHYAYQSAEYYWNDANIAGISLYSFQKNWLKWLLRFEPQKKQYDTYFMRMAMSWGQVWTKNKWREFKDWLSDHSEFSYSESIPPVLFTWPESSWLKFHDRYCIERNKYFVYPYVSVSTNCNEVGEHATSVITDHQVELQYDKTAFSFSPFNNDAICYDEYMERTGLGRYLGVTDEELTVSIWGTKPKALFKRYVLTIDSLPYKIVAKYGLSLRPAELNIICNYAGETIFLYDTSISCNKGNKRIDGDFQRYKYSIRSNDYRTIGKFSTKLSLKLFEDLKKKLRRIK